MPSNCIVKGHKLHANSGDDVHFHHLSRSNEKVCVQWLIQAGKTGKELANVRMISFEMLNMFMAF